MVAIPTVKLNNGLDMPILGLGTSTAETSEDRRKIVQAVYDAISIGYRHIDTAWLYKVEDQVGQAIKKAINDGLVKREDLFIVTKVWLWNLSHEAVLRQTQESLAKLQLDYADSLLIHWPTPMKDLGRDPGIECFPVDSDGRPAFDDSVDIYRDTWPAMEECVRRGWTKSIGLSNFNTEQVENLMKIAKIKPVLNQVESTPFLAQNKLKAVCDKYAIVLTAYSPLGQSAQANQDGTWTPHPLRTALFDNSVIKSLAAKYNKSICQILLKFQTDRGVSVIPKSVNKGRMSENMQIFDFHFDESDWKSLEAINCGWRSIPNSILEGSKYYPLFEDGK